MKISKYKEQFVYTINNKEFKVSAEVEFGTDADEDGEHFYRHFTIEDFSPYEHEGRSEEEVRYLIEDDVDSYINDWCEYYEEGQMDEFERHGVSRNDFL